MIEFVFFIVSAANIDSHPCFNLAARPSSAGWFSQSRPGWTSARIHPHNPLDRPATHSTEMICPRKHDAVYFRAVVPLCFVVGAFEGSDPPPVFFFAERRLFVL